MWPPTGGSKGFTPHLVFANCFTIDVSNDVHMYVNVSRVSVSVFFSQPIQPLQWEHNKAVTQNGPKPGKLGACLTGFSCALVVSFWNLFATKYLPAKIVSTMWFDCSSPSYGPEKRHTNFIIFRTWKDIQEVERIFFFFGVEINGSFLKLFTDCYPTSIS